LSAQISICPVSCFSAHLTGQLRLSRSARMQYPGRRRTYVVVTKKRFEMYATGEKTKRKSTIPKREPRSLHERAIWTWGLVSSDGEARPNICGDHTTLATRPLHHISSTQSRDDKLPNRKSEQRLQW